MQVAQKEGGVLWNLIGVYGKYSRDRETHQAEDLVVGLCRQSILRLVFDLYSISCVNQALSTWPCIIKQTIERLK